MQPILTYQGWPLNFAVIQKEESFHILVCTEKETEDNVCFLLYDYEPSTNRSKVTEHFQIADMTGKNIKMSDNHFVVSDDYNMVVFEMKKNGSVVELDRISCI